MTTNMRSIGQGVPADGSHRGVQLTKVIDHGNRAVPAAPGGPPSVWCTRVTLSGTRCKNEHLPEKDYCYAHAKGEK